MAWETRQRGSRYYTRSRRVHGQVVREYIGAGIIGEMAATQDAKARQKRSEEREVGRKVLAEQEALEHPLVVLDGLCDALVHSFLESAGYHNHRGQWRKRRGKKSSE